MHWVELRGGPLFWPPPSLDLTTLDLFSWGYVKINAKSMTLTSLEDKITRKDNWFVNEGITENQQENVFGKLENRIVLVMMVDMLKKKLNNK